MERNLTAVVLAGVHDWGSCPLHRAVVRPLVPIANRPLIDYALSAQQSAGAKHAVICANGSGAAVRSVIGDCTASGMSIDYYEDPMPRGPAGCIRDAAMALTSEPGDLIVMEAGVIPDFDLDAVIDAHRRAQASLTVATQPARGEESQRPVGVYVVSPEALDLIGQSGFQDIKEGVIPALHQAGHVVIACPIDGCAPKLLGIGAYFAINAWVLKRLASSAQPPDGYSVDDNAVVHRDARIDRSAVLLGPVMIGPGAVVAARAIVVGPTTVGADCLIDRRAVVTRSALWARSQIGAGACVDRSVVAAGACVGPDERIYHAVHMPEASDLRRQSQRRTCLASPGRSERGA